MAALRRECLDHMIVFGQAHLRRILGAYAAYYNESRTHRSLNKDAPFHRPIERLGAITAYLILGGRELQIPIRHATLGLNWELMMTAGQPGTTVIPKSPEDGVALAVSGGGYRAMVFHVGSLIRLNEVGLLKKRNSQAP